MARAFPDVARFRGVWSYLLVVSDPDPVARAVAEAWQPLPAEGPHVGGVPVRVLEPAIGVLRRPTWHVQDDSLELDLVSFPGEVPLVFPSVHRSEQGVDCFTVHPLGNLGQAAEVGGRAGALVPAPARLMASALRSLGERAPELGLPVTFEATHHGPWVSRPAFFAEIGMAGAETPEPRAVRLLADVLRRLEPDPQDAVVVGAGGGHYAPHFTDLVRRRHWAFGHMVPRHALSAGGADAVRGAAGATPGQNGVIYARAADAESIGEIEGVRRRRENEAPPRSRPSASPASGT